MSQRNQIQNSTAQTTNDSGGGILWSLFGPLIGMALIGLLGILVFGGIIVGMMGASVMGIEVSGFAGWVAILVGAIVINRIVAAA